MATSHDLLNAANGSNTVHLNGGLVDHTGSNDPVNDASHTLQQQQHQYEMQQHRFQNAQPQLTATSDIASKSTSGHSTPSHTRGHSNGRIPHEHYSEPRSNGSTSSNQLARWSQQQQDLQQLQEEEAHQQQLLQNHLLSNGNASKHPVYNTRIRHGFEADYESEQYMTFLAEVSSRGPS